MSAAGADLVELVLFVADVETLGATKVVFETDLSALFSEEEFALVEELVEEPKRMDFIFDFKRARMAIVNPGNLENSSALEA